MRLLRLCHGLAAGYSPLRLRQNNCRYFSSSQVHYDLTPFTRRLFKLPSAPAPPSQHHNDLTTFLSYADHISLPVTSTVHVGTHYEYTVLQILRRYALSLDRIGGRDDAGIDLVGTWHLPERERERALRVLVQCKSLKTKLGPNVVRELEGTFRQAPVGWRTGETVGVLVSPREATKGVRDTLARSAYPLFWMMIERDGTLKQALWNARAEELGVGLLEMVLTWDGCDIPHMDEVEKQLIEFAEQWVASWGMNLSEIQKGELLDVAERVLPHDVSAQLLDRTISDAERKKVIQALQERIQQQPTSE
ncbi:Endonuclease TnsA N-terminal/resolvase Hjc/tRNA endonuclease C-terminal [Penicillium mononematosum]|uniref:Endonuclease TnsA N-terminal/resolvase Hjc/tRNA endonuclease C-terminal n=1 Tax=Penicillium mononematosum TaxID=268346 RepID=UPI0025494B31|nr:Endonuclease TnsA N-terminal/resolvase Hjc/tRNA endonuclease C-terminal [Penicillium mononematosum]KAJ6188281.1 Endonuclease TnsA N-terminal/resolvase Hjc/tRNA endonuclease C-terminal [Penicillium mononematosum]